MKPLLATLFLSTLCNPVSAALVLTMGQNGNDVTTIGSGSLNLTGLTPGFASSSSTPNFAPGLGTLVTSPGNATPVDSYSSILSPSGGYGTSNTQYTSNGSATGDVFYVVGSVLGVPQNYVSEDPLAFTTTFGDTNLATIGASLGTYVWTLPNDTITLNVVETVPEPSSALLSLVGMAILSLYRRRV